jgi:hypothetical protein
LVQDSRIRWVNPNLDEFPRFPNELHGGLLQAGEFLGLVALPENVTLSIGPLGGIV